MATSIILAAGEGTRMKSKLPKVLHKVCGQTMIEYVIESAREAGCETNVVVVGHSKDKVKSSIENITGIQFVVQPIGEDEPYGTGFAVMQAKDYIRDDEQVIILCGDTPLVTGNTISELINFHKNGGYKATVLTARVDDPTGYGRIIRDKSDNVKAIVEHKDADSNQRAINEINSGIYCFEGGYLKKILDKIDNNNIQKEYYITDAVEILNNEGYNVGGFNVEDSTEIKGVNSRLQLAESEIIMRKRINGKLMMNGVTIIDPNNTYIESKVIIGKDTIVYPGVILEGETSIGEDCIIGHNTRIVNSKINNRVSIQTSTILESKVDDDTKIGPYAYLRPNSHIGKSVKIGDFVEIKNSNIGDNSKASHLAYVGDADVGNKVNIGCGVVFVNYDGKNKHRTIVNDNAFIGSNSNLVAPVVVGEYGYVAAGSTITEEVEEETLSIARARQVNKKGWVSKKNALKK